MTIGEWLRSREPQPPAALLARLEALLSDVLDQDASAAPAQFLAAGERLARDLVADASSTRETALELLAADALVTYAFEAGSVDPRGIERDAKEAMVRIASLVHAGQR